MPDQLFENPKLVAVYDHFDGERGDLDHYLSIVNEFEASTVIDIGSGTGCFAHLLENAGVKVIAVEPAKASLECAQAKSENSEIRWIHGIAEDLPDALGDLAIMTGNVAQVFISEIDWSRTLSSIFRALKPGGHFVFEVRDPSKKAWEQWNKENTHTVENIDNLGEVESWCEVLDISGQLVSFRWTYDFNSSGETLTSDSTLIFREREEVEESLRKVGFSVLEVRDAPDRPGKEFVFVTRKK